MRLVILTQYYPPEVGAAQRRLSEFAQRFIQAGHQVTVLTAMPNYPTGKIYPGYGGWLRREERDGVQVIHTWIYPTQKASFIHRLSNYFSFVLSAALIGTFALGRVDYVMVESPPLFLGFTAFWLTFIKRARLIFNVSDLWPESAVRLGVVREGSRAHRLSLWLERQCYQRAWLVTGQSRSILKDIEQRFPETSTFLLSNGVDVQQFHPERQTPEARAVLGQAKCIVLYAGLHGLAQGLDQLVEAAAQLPDIHFVLIGDGAEKADLIQQAAGLANMTFLDPHPAADLPPLVAAADIIAVTLKLYIPGAVPSKLYEAMASARPIVLVAEGEPVEIMTQHQAGLIIAPGDITGLVNAIQTLAADADQRHTLGMQGRRAAEQHFNRDIIARRFIEHLERGMA